MRFEGRRLLARMGMAFLVVLGAGALGVAVSHAQEDVISNPPELRDFKLEPDKPKPAPQPLPQPSTPLPSSGQTPPASRTPTASQSQAGAPRQGTTAQPAPDVVTRRPTPPTNRRSAGQTPPPVQRSSSAAKPPTIADPTATDAPAVAAPPDTGTQSPADNGSAEPLPSEAAEPAAAAQGSWSIWSLLLWLLIGAGLIGALVFFLRSRRGPVAPELSKTAHAPQPQPSPQPLLEPETAPDGTINAAPESLPNIALQSLRANGAANINEASSKTEPVIPAFLANEQPTAKQPPPDRPQLEIGFVPLKAMISLANLTITGELRIINAGNAPAKSLIVRAAIISASAAQNDAITAFHNDKSRAGDELGEAATGERLATEIELQIPLHELISYPMNDRRLFVPIMLANIVYDWGEDEQSDEARLSCLIGREATPAAAKMAPFWLDLGPRSIASLGQRPLFG